MKSVKDKPDYFLIIVVGFLIILGVIIIASVSALVSPDNPTLYLFRHFIRGLIPGLLLGFFAFKAPLYFFKKWSAVLLSLNLFLMVLVFLPGIGLTLGGASRWINLGIVTFQPSELLKLTFILYLAAWLAARTSGPEIKKKEIALKKFNRWSTTTLVAFLFVMALIALLFFLQPDASTLVLVSACALFMYFSAGTPFKHTVLIVLLAVCGLFVLIQTAPYRFERMSVFLDPEKDPTGFGFQIKQAIITIGSGGIFGMGLGMGIQRFLPHSLTDSIFAIFAEQAGFVGCVTVVALFTLFFWRGCVIATKIKDTFCKLTVLGISFWIASQAFVHIGVSLGLLPVTGMPLPFISYGGTATAVSLIGVGILLNISKNARKI